MDPSYLSSQVSTIISQLHGLFDEIGVPVHECETRESELFAALSETLHNQVRIVAAEKNDLTDEAQRIITTIKQMEISLDDNKGRHQYEAEDEELKITFPLSRCLQKLKEKHSQINKVHRDRFEQVKKLVQALESYSSHLESSFIKVTLPPSGDNASVPPTFDLSPSYVAALDNEFTRVYEEYTRRVATVKALSENIIQLYAELGTPQAQTDGTIIKYYRDSPEQLGLHEDDISRLRGKRDKLAEEKKLRERRLKELKTTVEALWDKLGVEEYEKKSFLNSNRGCGVRQINEFEDELARLNELKRQNLHLFVEDARFKLQALWDSLYFSEDEMLEFTPAFSDVYSDALLDAHEQEIERLETLREQRTPTLALIDKHRSLIKDRDELAASSQDASRLMMRGQKGEKRDPTRLLREEKMRKRIAKELPKIAVELRRTLEAWEDEYGRPFLVHGERYIDELDASETKAAPGPRSKTPSGFSGTSSVRGPPKSCPPSRSESVMGRANSVVSRNGSVRAPPSRSGAKTPVENSTIRRSQFASSVSTAGGRTPSKIPNRAPLTNLHNANNSERPQRSESVQDMSTMRKMGAANRAPPPKMRDIFDHPEDDQTPARHVRGDSVISIGSVRHVSPEDVYDDRDHTPSFPEQQRPRPKSYHDLHSNHRANERYANFPPPPAARQFSNASSVATTTVSGSENWETFDDTSEAEDDGNYYAHRQPSLTKRYISEDGYAPPRNNMIKRQRSLEPGASAGHELMAARDPRMISGSEANWTDEDAF